MMNANADTSPEYVLARSMIEHLKGAAHLQHAVFPEPWDTKEQARNIAVAAKASRFAIAVCPQTPQPIPGATNVASGFAARVSIVILTMRQVRPQSGMENLSAVIGKTLARAGSWAPAARGIPYAEPELESVLELDVAQYPDFQQANLLGAVINLSRKVNYKLFYNEH